MLAMWTASRFTTFKKVEEQRVSCSRGSSFFFGSGSFVERQEDALSPGLGQDSLDDGRGHRPKPLMLLEWCDLGAIE